MRGREVWCDSCAGNNLLQVKPAAPVLFGISLGISKGKLLVNNPVDIPDNSFNFWMLCESYRHLILQFNFYLTVKASLP